VASTSISAKAFGAIGICYPEGSEGKTGPNERARERCRYFVCSLSLFRDQFLPFEHMPNVLEPRTDITLWKTNLTDPMYI
jgi:hypothetical protein